MTTSRETNWMDHPEIRRLVHEINNLTIAERITLVKALVPRIADQLSEREYDGFVAVVRLKGARFQEAESPPGEGGGPRAGPGERELEGR